MSLKYEDGKQFVWEKILENPGGKGLVLAAWEPQMQLEVIPCLFDLLKKQRVSFGLNSEKPSEWYADYAPQDDINYFSIYNIRGHAETIVYVRCADNENSIRGLEVGWIWQDFTTPVSDVVKACCVCLNGVRPEILVQTRLCPDLGAKPRPLIIYN